MLKRKNPPNIRNKLKRKIWHRDNYTCQYCGLKADPKDYLNYRGLDDIHYNGGVCLEIDHIVPVSKGGETIETNLRVACHACNQAKKHKDVQIFLKLKISTK